MSRVMADVPAYLLTKAQGMGTSMTALDSITHLAASALKIMGFHRDAGTDDHAQALAFFLQLGRALKVISLYDAYGAGGHGRVAANTNREGGRSGPRRPNGKPQRRRKPRLQVVQ